MPRRISPQTSLENLKKEAKRRLKALRQGDKDARAQFARAIAKAPANPGLRDMQHAIALEFGFEGWTELKRELEKRPAKSGATPTKPVDVPALAQLANDLVLAHDAGDASALERLNRHYERQFTQEDVRAEIWRRLYSFRRRSRSGENGLQPSEAQAIVAQDAGYPSWEALTNAAATGTPPVAGYAIDAQHNRIAPRRQLQSTEWDALIGVMKERRITGLEAEGCMTDDVLRRVAELDHVTHLGLAGSQQLTDEGFANLGKMPQLESIDLGGKVTDRGLEVLQHLPNLRTFKATWHRGITDAGTANLRFCERLEEVNLMGTATGDGTVEALTGKRSLRFLNTGRLVTDAGLKFLREFPMYTKPRKTKIDFAVMGDIAESIHLLLDGPISNDGLASLRGLDGVEQLGLFWNTTQITSEGLAHVAGMKSLASLNCDGRICDDTAMSHIASIPRLKKLVAQEAVASEEGWIALSKSKTLEFLWGRECPNFGSRAFVAFSKMPKLKALGIGCAAVDDAALATLPKFPALREITAIGFDDAGFRHIGRCERLERLLCMYCRGTGDEATAHIAGLKRLKSYYAGVTHITDRSLEILGQIDSLEKVEFYECVGITDAGLKHLARLPRLKQIDIAASPKVTLAGTAVFPDSVQVNYVLGG